MCGEPSTPATRKTALAPPAPPDVLQFDAGTAVSTWKVGGAPADTNRVQARKLYLHLGVEDARQTMLYIERVGEQTLNEEPQRSRRMRI
jgi:hypothetical protein